MMKKNKLYTVNRWNQPAFMPQEKNLFSGLFGSSQMNQPFRFTGFTPGAQAAIDKNIAASLPKAGGLLGNIGDKLKGVFGGGNQAGSPMGGIISAAGNLVGGLGNSIISGGLSSGAGSAVSGIGSTVGGLIGSVNPVLGGIVSAGSGILGGGINALFGESIDEEALQAANAGTNAYNNFTSNAGSFEGITGPEVQANVKDVYRGGLFNDVSDKNEALKKERANARSWAFRSVDNNINNLVNDQMNDYLASYRAFGGKINNRGLTMPKKHKFNFGGYTTGLIGDLNTSMELPSPEEQYQMYGRGLLMPGESNVMGGKGPDTFTWANGGRLFSIGGDLQTHGGDFSDGLTIINAGGSHSENPNEGVQLGVDPEGTPNLVEENETVWNDYVFSARIPIDDTTKEMFHISKKREMTYADLSKKLEKEIAERVNDPISKAGFEKQMQQLEEQQERQKQEMEAERAKAAFEALTPEEKVAVMENAAQQGAMAEQAAQEQAIAEQQAMQQATPEELALAEQAQQQADGSNAALGQPAPEMAEGGKLFANGGKKNSGKWKNDKENHWDVYTKAGLRKYIEEAKKRIDAAPDDKKDDVRRQIANEFNALQQSYYDNVLPQGVTGNFAYDEGVRNHQRMFDNMYGNTGFYSMDDKGNITNLIANAIDMPKGHSTSDTPVNWADGYAGPRTSIRNFGSTEYGDDSYYSDLVNEFKDKLGLDYVPNDQWEYGDNRQHALYGVSLASPQAAMAERTTSPELEAAWNYGDPSIPRDADGNIVEAAAETPGKAETPAEKKTRGVRPDLRRETSLGMFGPLVNLGMMFAGVGKPDTGAYDAAVRGAGNVHLAGYDTIGNRLTYKPLDIWFAQNRADALSKATDRNLMNISGGNRGTAMAGLLANGLNSQIANGNLFRQGVESNLAQEERREAFNRDTDKYNADAYTRNSMFNASAINDAMARGVNARIHAAQVKDDANRWWASNLYGNVNSLFDRVNQWEKWKRDHNTVARMAADSLFGNMSDQQYIGDGYLKSAAEGGKIKRNKNKKRGLTF